MKFVLMAGLHEQYHPTEFEKNDAGETIVDVMVVGGKEERRPRRKKETFHAQVFDDRGRPMQMPAGSSGNIVESDVDLAKRWPTKFRYLDAGQTSSPAISGLDPEKMSAAMCKLYCHENNIDTKECKTLEQYRAKVHEHLGEPVGV